MKDLLNLCLFLVIVVKCTGLDCRTCQGLECFKSIIPSLKCKRNYPNLPFQLDFNSRENIRNSQYGCLALEYYIGKRVYSIQQCFPLIQGNCICERLKQIVQVKKCTFSTPMQGENRWNDNIDCEKPERANKYEANGDSDEWEEIEYKQKEKEEKKTAEKNKKDLEYKMKLQEEKVKWETEHIYKANTNKEQELNENISEQKYGDNLSSLMNIVSWLTGSSYNTEKESKSPMNDSPLSSGTIKSTPRDQTKVAPNLPYQDTTPTFSTIQSDHSNIKTEKITMLNSSATKIIISSKKPLTTMPKNVTAEVLFLLPNKVTSANIDNGNNKTSTTTYNSILIETQKAATTSLDQINNAKDSMPIKTQTAAPNVMAGVLASPTTMSPAADVNIKAYENIPIKIEKPETIMLAENSPSEPTETINTDNNYISTKISPIIQDDPSENVKSTTIALNMFPENIVEKHLHTEAAIIPLSTEKHTFATKNFLEQAKSNILTTGSSTNMMSASELNIPELNEITNEITNLGKNTVLVEEGVLFTKPSTTSKYVSITPTEPRSATNGEKQQIGEFEVNTIESSTTPPKRVRKDCSNPASWITDSSIIKVDKPDLSLYTLKQNNNVADKIPSLPSARPQHIGSVSKSTESLKDIFNSDLLTIFSDRKRVTRPKKIYTPSGEQQNIMYSQQTTTSPEKSIVLAKDETNIEETNSFSTTTLDYSENDILILKPMVITKEPLRDIETWPEDAKNKKEVAGVGILDTSTRTDIAATSVISFEKNSYKPKSWHSDILEATSPANIESNIKVTTENGEFVSRIISQIVDRFQNNTGQITKLPSESSKASENILASKLKDNILTEDKIMASTKRDDYGKVTQQEEVMESVRSTSRSNENIITNAPEALDKASNNDNILKTTLNWKMTDYITAEDIVTTFNTNDNKQKAIEMPEQSEKPTIQVNIITEDIFASNAMDNFAKNSKDYAYSTATIVQLFGKDNDIFNSDSATMAQKSVQSVDSITHYNEDNKSGARRVIEETTHTNDIRTSKRTNDLSTRNTVRQVTEFNVGVYETEQNNLRILEKSEWLTNENSDPYTEILMSISTDSHQSTDKDNYGTDKNILGWSQQSDKSTILNNSVLAETLISEILDSYQSSEKDAEYSTISNTNYLDPENNIVNSDSVTVLQAEIKAVTLPTELNKKVKEDNSRSTEILPQANENFQETLTPEIIDDVSTSSIVNLPIESSTNTYETEGINLGMSEKSDSSTIINHGVFTETLISQIPNFYQSSDKDGKYITISNTDDLETESNIVNSDSVTISQDERKAVTLTTELNENNKGDKSRSTEVLPQANENFEETLTPEIIDDVTGSSIVSLPIESNTNIYASEEIYLGMSKQSDSSTIINDCVFTETLKSEIPNSYQSSDKDGKYSTISNTDDLETESNIVNSASVTVLQDEIKAVTLPTELNEKIKEDNSRSTEILPQANENFEETSTPEIIDDVTTSSIVNLPIESNTNIYASEEINLGMSEQSDSSTIINDGVFTETLISEIPNSYQSSDKDGKYSTISNTDDLETESNIVNSASVTVLQDEIKAVTLPTELNEKIKEDNSRSTEILPQANENFEETSTPEIIDDVTTSSIVNLPIESNTNIYASEEINLGMSEQSDSSTIINDSVFTETLISEIPDSYQSNDKDAEYSTISNTDNLETVSNLVNSDSVTILQDERKAVTLTTELNENNKGDKSRSTEVLPQANENFEETLTPEIIDDVTGSSIVSLPIESNTNIYAGEEINLGMSKQSDSSTIINDSVFTGTLISEIPDSYHSNDKDAEYSTISNTDNLETESNLVNSDSVTILQDERKAVTLTTELNEKIKEDNSRSTEILPQANENFEETSTPEIIDDVTTSSIVNLPMESNTMIYASEEINLGMSEQSDSSTIINDGVFTETLISEIPNSYQSSDKDAEYSTISNTDNLETESNLVNSDSVTILQDERKAVTLTTELNENNKGDNSRSTEVLPQANENFQETLTPEIIDDVTTSSIVNLPMESNTMIYASEEINLGMSEQSDSSTIINDGVFTETLISEIPNSYQSSDKDGKYSTISNTDDLETESNIVNSASVTVLQDEIKAVTLPTELNEKIKEDNSRSTEILPQANENFEETLTLEIIDDVTTSSIVNLPIESNTNIYASEEINLGMSEQSDSSTIINDSIFAGTLISEIPDSYLSNDKDAEYSTISNTDNLETEGNLVNSDSVTILQDERKAVTLTTELNQNNKGDNSRSTEILPQANENFEETSTREIIDDVTTSSIVNLPIESTTNIYATENINLGMSERLDSPTTVNNGVYTEKLLSEIPDSYQSNDKYAEYSTIANTNDLVKENNKVDSDPVTLLQDEIKAATLPTELNEKIKEDNSRSTEILPQANENFEETSTREIIDDVTTSSIVNLPIESTTNIYATENINLGMSERLDSPTTVNNGVYTEKLLSEIPDSYQSNDKYAEYSTIANTNDLVKENNKVDSDPVTLLQDEIKAATLPTELNEKIKEDNSRSTEILPQANENFQETLTPEIIDDVSTSRIVFLPIESITNTYETEEINLGMSKPSDISTIINDGVFTETLISEIQDFYQSSKKDAEYSTISNTNDLETENNIVNFDSVTVLQDEIKAVTLPTELNEKIKAENSRSTEILPQANENSEETSTPEIIDDVTTSSIVNLPIESNTNIYASEEINLGMSEQSDSSTIINDGVFTETLIYVIPNSYQSSDKDGKYSTISNTDDLETESNLVNSDSVTILQDEKKAVTLTTELNENNKGDNSRSTEVLPQANENFQETLTPEIIDDVSTSRIVFLPIESITNTYETEEINLGMSKPSDISTIINDGVFTETLISEIQDFYQSSKKDAEYSTISNTNDLETENNIVNFDSVTVLQDEIKAVTLPKELNEKIKEDNSRSTEILPQANENFEETSTPEIIDDVTTSSIVNLPIESNTNIYASEEINLGMSEQSDSSTIINDGALTETLISEIQDFYQSSEKDAEYSKISNTNDLETESNIVNSYSVTVLQDEIKAVTLPTELNEKIKAENSRSTEILPQANENFQKTLNNEIIDDVLTSTIVNLPIESSTNSYETEEINLGMSEQSDSSTIINDGAFTETLISEIQDFYQSSEKDAEYLTISNTNDLETESNIVNSDSVTMLQDEIKAVTLTTELNERNKADNSRGTEILPQANENFQNTLTSETTDDFSTSTIVNMPIESTTNTYATENINLGMSERLDSPTTINNGVYTKKLISEIPDSSQSNDKNAEYSTTANTNDLGKENNKVDSDPVTLLQDEINAVTLPTELNEKIKADNSRGTEILPQANENFQNILTSKITDDFSTSTIVNLPIESTTNTYATEEINLIMSEWLDSPTTVDNGVYTETLICEIPDFYQSSDKDAEYLTISNTNDLDTENNIVNSDSVTMLQDEITAVTLPTELNEKINAENSRSTEILPQANKKFQKTLTPEIIDDFSTSNVGNVLIESTTDTFETEEINLGMSEQSDSSTIINDGVFTETLISEIPDSYQSNDKDAEYSTISNTNDLGKENNKVDFDPVTLLQDEIKAVTLPTELNEKIKADNSRSTEILPQANENFQETMTPEVIDDVPTSSIVNLPIESSTNTYETEEINLGMSEQSDSSTIINDGVFTETLISEIQDFYQSSEKDSKYSTISNTNDLETENNRVNSDSVTLLQDEIKAVALPKELNEKIKADNSRGTEILPQANENFQETMTPEVIDDVPTSSIVNLPIESTTNTYATEEINLETSERSDSPTTVNNGVYTETLISEIPDSYQSSEKDAEYSTISNTNDLDTENNIDNSDSVTVLQDEIKAVTLTTELNERYKAENSGDTEILPQANENFQNTLTSEITDDFSTSTIVNLPIESTTNSYAIEEINLGKSEQSDSSAIINDGVFTETLISEIPNSYQSSDKDIEYSTISNTDDLGTENNIVNSDSVTMLQDEKKAVTLTTELNENNKGENSRGTEVLPQANENFQKTLTSEITDDFSTSNIVNLPLDSSTNSYATEEINLGMSEQSDSSTIINDGVFTETLISEIPDSYQSGNKDGEYLTISNTNDLETENNIVNFDSVTMLQNKSKTITLPTEINEKIKAGNSRSTEVLPQANENFQETLTPELIDDVSTSSIVNLPIESTTNTYATEENNLGMSEQSDSPTIVNDGVFTETLISEIPDSYQSGDKDGEYSTISNRNDLETENNIVNFDSVTMLQNENKAVTLPTELNENIKAGNLRSTEVFPHANEIFQMTLAPEMIDDFLTSSIVKQLTESTRHASRTEEINLGMSERLDKSNNLNHDSFMEVLTSESMDYSQSSDKDNVYATISNRIDFELENNILGFDSVTILKNERNAMELLESTTMYNEDIDADNLRERKQIPHSNEIFKDTLIPVMSDDSLAEQQQSTESSADDYETEENIHLLEQSHKLNDKNNRTTEALFSNTDISILNDEIELDPKKLNIKSMEEGHFIFTTDAVFVPEESFRTETEQVTELTSEYEETYSSREPNDSAPIMNMIQGAESTPRSDNSLSTVLPKEDVTHYESVNILFETWPSLRPEQSILNIQESVKIVTENINNKLENHDEMSNTLTVLSKANVHDYYKEIGATAKMEESVTTGNVEIFEYVLNSDVRLTSDFQEDIEYSTETFIDYFERYNDTEEEFDNSLEKVIGKVPSVSNIQKNILLETWPTLDPQQGVSSNTEEFDEITQNFDEILTLQISVIIKENSIFKFDPLSALEDNLSVNIEQSTKNTATLDNGNSFIESESNDESFKKLSVLPIKYTNIYVDSIISQTTDATFKREYESSPSKLNTFELEHDILLELNNGFDGSLQEDSEETTDQLHKSTSYATELLEKIVNSETLVSTALEIDDDITSTHMSTPLIGKPLSEDTIDFTEINLYPLEKREHNVDLVESVPSVSKPTMENIEPTTEYYSLFDTGSLLISEQASGLVADNLLSKATPGILAANNSISSEAVVQNTENIFPNNSTNSNTSTLMPNPLISIEITVTTPVSNDKISTETTKSFPKEDENTTTNTASVKPTTGNKLTPDKTAFNTNTESTIEVPPETPINSAPIITTEKISGSTSNLGTTKSSQIYSSTITTGELSSIKSTTETSEEKSDISSSATDSTLTSRSTQKASESTGTARVTTEKPEYAEPNNCDYDSISGSSRLIPFWSVFLLPLFITILNNM